MARSLNHPVKKFSFKKRDNKNVHFFISIKYTSIKDWTLLLLPGVLADFRGKWESKTAYYKIMETLYYYVHFNRIVILGRGRK